MKSMKSVLTELENARDELKLKIHLGSKELQDEWNELETKYNKFKSEAELDKSSDDIESAAKELVGEISNAYSRIRKAL